MNEQIQLPNHQQQYTAVPFVWYKTPEDQTTSASPECGSGHDERNALSTSLTSDVDESEHVDNEEEDDVLSSLISAHFNSLASATVGDAASVAEHMDDCISQTERHQECDSSNRHTLSHTARKPRPCDGYELRFAEFAARSDLGEHTLTNRGEKPFSCGVCHKEFSTYTTVRGHLSRTHTDPNLFRCRACRKQFVMKRCLDVHVRETHIIFNRS